MPCASSSRMSKANCLALFILVIFFVPISFTISAILPFGEANQSDKPSTVRELATSQIGQSNNRIRYARNSETSSRAFITSNHIPAIVSYPYTNSKPYRINTPVPINTYRRDRLLDSEDRYLLDKFYRETREKDPFLSGVNQLTPENLWSESDTSALLDTPLKIDNGSEMTTIKPQELLHTQVGWSIFEDLLSNHYKKAAHLGAKQREVLQTFATDDRQATQLQYQARYSPTIKLLTSFDPTSDQNLSSMLRGNRIVGATLASKDTNQIRQDDMVVKSKSALDAVRLHDELMRPAPRDGKVRVRMYYHRAIHDDAKLYGTGPWRYWGHGWGLEYGFDPKRANERNFYQRGYTMERAFGRDFCIKAGRCRPSEPNFLNYPTTN